MFHNIVKENNIKKLLIFLLITLPLLAGTIDSTEVNKLIEFKKEQQLSKYNPQNIKKPLNVKIDKNNYKVKKIEKGKYESTKKFNVRVKNEEKRVENLYKKDLNAQNSKYKKELASYNTKVRNEKKKQAKIEKNLPNVLQYTFKNALKIYLGKPKIGNFDNYNADDEVFITKIGNDKFSIRVAIQIKAEEAQKLDKKNLLRYLKPQITLEYTDGNLYISKVEVRYKGKSYPVNIVNLSNYNSSFKLKDKIKDTFILWSDAKIKDRKLISDMKKIEVAEKKRQRKLDLVSTKDGLIWQDDKATKVLKLNWDTAKGYCEFLNLDNKHDWRLPNKKELESIVDKHNKSMIKKDFKNIAADSYWSSTLGVSDNSIVWTVDFKNGTTHYNRSLNKKHFRCVRGR